jgi:hypothetical protein
MARSPVRIRDASRRIARFSRGSRVHTVERGAAKDAAAPGA